MSRFPKEFTEGNSLISLKTDLLDKLRLSAQKIQELERALAQEKEDHQNTKRSYEDRIAALNADFFAREEDLKKNISDLKAENEEVRGKLRDQINFHDMINKTMEQNKKLEGDLAASYDMIQEKTRDFENMKKELIDQGKEFQQALNKPGPVQMELSESKKNNTKLGEELDDSKREIRDLEEKIKTMEKEKAITDEQLEKAKDHIVFCDQMKKLNENEKLKKENQGIKEKLDKKEKDCTKLNSDLEATKKEFTDLKKKYEEINKQLEEAKKERNLEKENAELKKQIFQIQARIEELKKEDNKANSK